MGRKNLPGTCDIRIEILSGCLKFLKEVKLNYKLKIMPILFRYGGYKK
jgi:hypothetical protein